MNKIYLGRNKKFLGVCSGVANYFGIDPTLIRIILVCVSLYTVIIPTLLVYIGLSFVFSKAPDDYIEPVPAKVLKKGREKRIGGVCSGLSEFFGFDATILRLVFLVFVLFFGCGVLTYIVCMLLMPPADYVDADFNV